MVGVRRVIKVISLAEIIDFRTDSHRFPGKIQIGVKGIFWPAEKISLMIQISGLKMSPAGGQVKIFNGRNFQRHLQPTGSGPSEVLIACAIVKLNQMFESGFKISQGKGQAIKKAFFHSSIPAQIFFRLQRGIANWPEIVWWSIKLIEGGSFKTGAKSEFEPGFLLWPVKISCQPEGGCRSEALVVVKANARS